MMQTFIGHSSEDGRLQSLKKHLEKTGELAGIFADAFDAKEWGEIAGIYHDIGKYSAEFQNRILGNGNKVDHSTAGAKEIQKTNCSILAFCIAGHHTGIPNGGSRFDTADSGTLCGRLKKKLCNYEAYKTDNLSLDTKDVKIPINYVIPGFFESSFFIRMLYSCLVDADYLDTEEFMSDGKINRSGYEDISVLYDKLKNFIQKFDNPKTDINKRRYKILNSCLKSAENAPGLFTLTVPTGGGKTIASLAFALKHALRFQKKRIIYVIPYTSIIEQNSKVFADILGWQNIVEHHMNVVYDNKDDENGLINIKKLSTENWDAPIIVTTNVQFFESLYANKPSKCRKLHNIADSVIIFDEAQMLPIHYLQPCVKAIEELIKNYKVTAVLCTATQPPLDSFFSPEVKITEICPQAEVYFQLFKRVKFKNMGKIENATLIKKLNNKNKVLCIVNTKKEAQDIFKHFTGDNRFHLSTNMFPKHRKKILEKIRECLSEQSSCQVVSTSLIEAGVDIDFPCVFRELTGIDSIIQAGGRCNREGHKNANDSFVYVFELEKTQNKILPYNSQEIETARIVLNNFKDFSQIDAITDYFNKLYGFKGQAIDSKRILPKIDLGNFPFVDIAKEFNIIADNTYSIFVSISEEAKFIETRIRNGERNKTLMREIGQYVVNVYENDFNKLYNTSKIEHLDDSINILIDTTLYSNEVGLKVNINDGEGIVL